MTGGCGMVSEERLDTYLSENRRRHPHFSVAPRYSPGSPALVNRATALRVAADEEEAYRHTVDHRYSDERREEALLKGLVGIAEVRAETLKGWDVLDLITGERYIRPFKKPS